MKNSTKNYLKHLKIEKMLVPGPGDRGSDPILLFLTPKSDSVGRNTIYNSPQIPSYDYFTCLAIVTVASKPFEIQSWDWSRMKDLSKIFKNT